jgi:hypothetical protein
MKIKSATRRRSMAEVTVEATTLTVNAVPADVPQAYLWELTVERRGPDSWAVCRMRECLGADGEWWFESIPSERSDEWLRTHRFDLSTAVRLARLEAPKVTVNGLSVADVLARHSQSAGES